MYLNWTVILGRKLEKVVKTWYTFDHPHFRCTLQTLVKPFKGKIFGFLPLPLRSTESECLGGGQQAFIYLKNSKDNLDCTHLRTSIWHHQYRPFGSTSSVVLLTTLRKKKSLLVVLMKNRHNYLYNQGRPAFKQYFTSSIQGVFVNCLQIAGFCAWHLDSKMSQMETLPSGSLDGALIHVDTWCSNKIAMSGYPGWVFQGRSWRESDSESSKSVWIGSWKPCRIWTYR